MFLWLIAGGEKGASALESNVALEVSATGMVLGSPSFFLWLVSFARDCPFGITYGLLVVGRGLDGGLDASAVFCSTLSCTAETETGSSTR